MRTKTIIEPRYQETDQMGVIHHSVYPVWYEVGRVDFLKQVEYPYEKINALGVDLAVIDLHSTFIKPAHFGEKLTCHTWISHMSKLKLTLSYEIYNEDDVVINKGYSVHTWVDQHLKLVQVEKKYPELYQLFQSLIEA